MAMKLRFSDVKNLRTQIQVLSGIGVEFKTVIPTSGRVSADSLIALARELHSREDVELTWTAFFPESLLKGKTAEPKSKPSKTYGVVATVNGELRVFPVTVKEIRERFGASVGRVSDASLLTVARENEGWTDEDDVVLVTVGMMVNKPVRDIPAVVVTAQDDPEDTDISSEGDDTGEVISDAEGLSETPDEVDIEPADKPAGETIAEAAPVKPKRTRKTASV